MREKGKAPAVPATGLPERGRCVRAAAAVALMLAAVVISGFSAPSGCAGVGAGAARALPANDAPAISFDSEDGASVDFGGATPRLPAGFETEACLPASAREVSCYAAGPDGASVIGCVVAGEAAAVLADFAAALGEKGWSERSLGGVTGSSFAKADGSIRWLAVTCDQVGDDVCVVVRVLGEGDGR